jgi:sortase A
VAARIHGALLSRAAISIISPSHAESSVTEDQKQHLDVSPADFSLWSEKRIEGYKESLVEHIGPPLAILRVAKIHLEVPVLDGTDDLILNRGVYVVDSIKIVDPKDVSVLRPTKVPSLTLVTCYPFYFIGSAPQRYIVHASITDSDQPTNNTLKLLNSTVLTKNNEVTK